MSEFLTLANSNLNLELSVLLGDKLIKLINSLVTFLGIILIILIARRSTHAQKEF